MTPNLINAIFIRMINFMKSFLVGELGQTDKDKKARYLASESHPDAVLKKRSWLGN